MKVLSVVVFCLFFSNIFGQEIAEKELKTEVSEVTVFIDKAQITRQKAVELPSGITVLKFVNLSPFIDAKSVQVKANGDVTVLAVNHQQNFLDKLEKPKEVEKIEARIKEIDNQLNLEQTYLFILNEELAFLNVNRVIGGKDNELNIVTLKEAAMFYSSQLTKLKLQQIEKNRAVDNLKKQKREFQNQLNTLSSKKEFSTGEIVVKVQTKVQTKPNFEVSYLVDNAGWYPSYDIRAKTINDPIEIIYKANVRQDSKVDWKNIKLKFSSSNPSLSGIAPELKIYYLDYYSVPPSYKQSINMVSGQVTDENNNPMPGASVVIAKSTIGTATDMDGKYSLTIPSDAQHLVYSFIGYHSETVPITNSIRNVALLPNELALDDIVVVGYGTQKKKSVVGALQGKVAGVSVRNNSRVKSRESTSIAIPFQNTEKQTTVEFEIRTPYSLKSGNKSYAVDMAVLNVPASYQYFSIPKINTDAFLVANIVDWEKYNLLEGEANLFFEETYVGKTILDVRNAADTLQLSLGKDKNVSVKREKVKDFTTKKFMGSKKVETRAWETIIKNNKNQAINMVILDQAPVPKLEEIEIDILEISRGKHTKENGEIRWEFTLKPMEKKELTMKYSVKYPKSKSLIIE